MTEDLKYWNALNQNMNIGPVRFQKLFSYFENMEHAWKASSSEFIKAGIEKKVADYIDIKKKEINPDAEMQKVINENISIITIKDDFYPAYLKEIYNPPALLYIRGNFEADDEQSLGVVGTRKLSDYAKIITPDIINDLVNNKITIISGLALGVDSLAHNASLKNSGRTLAVLGSGIDNKSIYPYSNKILAQKIIQNGAIVSEYPIGTMPLKQNFPARNRIISGLSRGTLVIEAPENSGALITAKFALEQNREVFAIPGNITSRNSIGPNNLIKQGAKLVSSAQDILDELSLNLATEFSKSKKIAPETKEEETILKFLSKDPIHIDKLIAQTGLSAPQLNSSLTLMEMKGKVRNLGGMMYVLNQ